MSNDTPIHPLQALVDGMGAAWQRQRAESQMTLGKLIEELSALDPDRQVTGLGSLRSYRGYYSDLSFDPDIKQAETVGELLVRCRAAMGEVFTGYKGGDFTMGKTTPLWVAEYGCTGERLMSLNIEANPIAPVTKPEEE